MAFEDGLGDLHRNSLDLPCTNSLQPTLCHYIPGRAHVEKAFRISVMTPLVVPGPIHTEDLLRVNDCPLDIAKLLYI